MTESNHFPLFRPEMMPKTMPKSPSKTKAMMASLIVTGKARPMMDRTGCPEKVRPKSRVTAFFRKRRYWTKKGLSRLYSALIWAATC